MSLLSGWSVHILNLGEDEIAALDPDITEHTDWYRCPEIAPLSTKTHPSLLQGDIRDKGLANLERDRGMTHSSFPVPCKISAS